MNVENSNTISEDINSTSTSNEYLNKKIFSSNDLVELLQPKQQPKDKDNSGALLFFVCWLFVVFALVGYFLVLYSSCNTKIFECNKYFIILQCNSIFKKIFKYKYF